MQRTIHGMFKARSHFLGNCEDLSTPQPNGPVVEITMAFSHQELSTSSDSNLALNFSDSDLASNLYSNSVIHEVFSSEKMLCVTMYLQPFECDGQ